MRTIFLFLIVVSSIVSAQNADALFADANNLYRDGKYEDAIAMYQKIEDTKQVSSELYYNLGNCYYKLNQVAPSIYHYEKALLLNPLNDDAKNNLIIAKRLTLDRIEALPKTLFQKINQNYLEALHYNTWAYITILFSILGGILFILFYWSSTPNKKRIFFTTSIISFVLLIATLLISFQQYNAVQHKLEAIIFDTEVQIKNAPTNNADAVFVLHEGTKVLVLDTVDTWKKIKLEDGKIGWIQSESMRLLNKF